MPELALYFAPGSCSRVSIITMFEKGIPFEPRLVRFMAGDHKKPEYRALNPQGKVPLLLVDGKPLAENVAILTWLARTFSEKKILPFTGNAMEDAEVLSDLAWCAAGMHPIVTRLRVPQFICDLDGTRDRVFEMASDAMKPNFEIVDRRLADRDWMYGEWSALDAYIYWVWFRATGAGFDGSPYRRFADHARRMEQLEGVKKLLGLEEKAEADLKAQGMDFKFANIKR
jgi:glutathione S-transferase